MNGNTTITATVYDSEQNTLPGIKVDFNSDKGSLSPVSILTNSAGKALVVFTTGDTPGTVIITATVSIVGDENIQNQLNLPVESLNPAGSIEYVFTGDTSEKEMGVKGSGLNENLEVSFLVKDSLGNPAADDTEVQFDLLVVGGDEYLSSNTGYTKNGIASTYINSGIMSGTVVVIASVEVNGVKLQTASRDFVIWSCPPDANHFGIGAEIYNIAGRIWNGKSTKIIARLADQYGNPVPKGTVVYFTTECGSITASSWTNESGYAEATLTSQNPKPDDGFVTVMAFTVGQESYFDINSNGIYDPNDDIFVADWYDLSEPYLDSNWNRQYDEGERFWDEPFPLFPNENKWDTGNEQWDKKLFIWGDIEVLFSGSTEIWIYNEKPNISYFGRGNIPESPSPLMSSAMGSFSDANNMVLIPNGQSEEFYIIVADDLGNPLVLGTKISIELEEASFDPNDPNNACSFKISGETDYTIESFWPDITKKLFTVDVYNTSNQDIGCVVNLVVKVTSKEDNGNKELRLKLSSK